MGKLFIQPKKVVVPGDKIAEGLDFVPSNGTYRQGENLYANKVGFLSVRGRIIKVIAFSGAYIPEIDDVVVGKVTDIGFSGWNIDVGTSQDALMPIGEAVSEYIKKDEDLSRYFGVDDLVMVKIIGTTKTGYVTVSAKGHGLGKIRNSYLTKIDPHKVPRLIGKKGSMITLIKKYTNTDIFVGQNGWVSIRGESEDKLLAERTIKYVEKNCHVDGLTNKVEELLKKETGGKK